MNRAGPERQTWVFDVDGCLIDSLTGGSLRPGATEVLAAIRAAGHRILLWSAGGADYARSRASQHGIGHYFDACHGKNERGPDGRYLTGHLGPDLGGMVFVDDQPGDLPAAARCVAVTPYIRDDSHDRALVAIFANRPC